MKVNKAIKPEQRKVAFRILGKGSKATGFTEMRVGQMEENGKFSVYVLHAGNMGNTIKNVSNNLERIGLPSVDELKKLFPNHEETGSPDYAWGLTFTIQI